MPVARRVAEALPRGVLERRRGAEEHLGLGLALGLGSGLGLELGLGLGLELGLGLGLELGLGLGLGLELGLGLGLGSGGAPRRWAATPSARRRGDSNSREGHACWEGRATWPG